MNDKQYKTMKTVYMIVLCILLLFLVKLFIVFLITGTGFAGFIGGHMFCSPRRFAVNKNTGGYDFSDFRMLDRRIEIDIPFDRLDVDWHKGDVRVRFADDVTAPYAEVKNGKANIMYKKSGNALHIVDKRGKRRPRFTDIENNSDCDIEVVLPADHSLEVLGVGTVSGDIRLSEIQVRSVRLNAVGSDIRVTGYTEDIHIDAVSGNAEIKSRGNLKRLTVQSVNSDLRLFVPQGQKVRVNASSVVNRIEFLNNDIEAVSGEQAADVSINSVHADVVIGHL